MQSYNGIYICSPTMEVTHAFVHITFDACSTDCLIKCSFGQHSLMQAAHQAAAELIAACLAFSAMCVCLAFVM